MSGALVMCTCEEHRLIVANVPRSIGIERTPLPQRRTARGRAWGLLGVVIAGWTVVALDIRVPDVVLLPFLAVPLLLAAWLTSMFTTVMLGSVWLVVATMAEWLRGDLAGQAWVRLSALTAVLVTAGLIAQWRTRLETHQQRLQQDLVASEQHYRILAQGVSEAALLLDREGLITWVSPGVATTLHWSPADLDGVHLRVLVHPDERAAFDQFLTQASHSMPPDAPAIRMHRKNDSYLWCRVHATPVRDESGDFVGVVLGLSDIQELVMSRQRLSSDEDLLRAISDSILDPLVFLKPVYDDEGVIVDFRYEQVNTAMCNYLAKRREDILGQSLLSLTPGVRESGLFDSFIHTLTTGEPMAMNDVPYFNEVLGNLRHYDIRANRTRDGLTLTWRDVTPRVEAARVMASLAQIDPVTGLLNRSEGIRRLESVVSGRRTPGHEIAAIFCDIDRFKQINDTYGHAVGDHVLHEVALRIRASVRDSDIVTRFGGDEILVLLEGVHREADAHQVADTIERHMRAPIVVENQHIPVTLSMGITVAHPDEDVPSLIARADQAMYAAKRAGRHQIITLPAIPVTPTSQP